jgi:hypothetical protein
MIEAPDQTPTAVTAFLHATLGAHVAEGLARLQDSLEQATTEEEAAAAVGVPVSHLTDPLLSALIPYRMAFRQLSVTMLASSKLHFDDDELAAAGANAKPPTTIHSSNTAEYVLRDLYDRVDPAILEPILSRPGAVESLQDFGNSSQLHHFADGSSFIRIPSGSPAKCELMRQILDAATRVDQVLKPEAAAALRGSFAKITSDMRSAMTADGQRPDNSPDFIAAVDALVDEAALGVLRHINDQPGTIIPFDSPKKVAETFVKIAKDGQWPAGYSLAIDGRPCPFPSDVEAALGVQAPLSLDGALERLRASRQASAEPAPAGVAAKPSPRKAKAC